MIKLLTFAFALCISTFAFADELDDAIAALEAERTSTKMSELQYAQKHAAILKKHLPEDYEAHTLAAYRILIATQLQEKKISKAEHDYMWEERKNAFMAKRAETIERLKAEHEYQATRKRIDEMNAADRAEKAQQHRQQQLAAQEAEASRQNALANAFLLQGIGNAVQRSAPPPAVRCTSNSYGGTVFTNCN